MRIATMLGAAALVLAPLSLGCASGPKLPPKASPEEVQIFFPGTSPTESFKAMGTITEAASLATSDEELIAAARKRAAAMGADALIIRSIRRTTEGAVATDVQLEERKILEGIAIYYPAKHPKT